MRIDNPTEFAYTLAIAIYDIALMEAEGELGHHVDEPVEKLWSIQQEAHAFCQEWQDFFAARLQPSASIKPLPAPSRPKPRQAQGGRKPKGQAPIWTRAADWLRDHGPATAGEIAAALDCKRENATNVMRTRPGLFRIAGTRLQDGQPVTVWDVKRDARK
jgi:hypothetical protein